jgi:hypothetical protein
MWASETNRLSNGLGYVEDLTNLSQESLFQRHAFDNSEPEDRLKSMATEQGEAECILDALQEQIIKTQMIEFDQAKRALEEVCSAPSSKEAFGLGKSL